MATNTLHFTLVSRERTAQSQTAGPLVEIQRENKRLKMLYSRWMLPSLALYLLLEEISAAVLPSRFRNKREVSWLDQEVFSHLFDPSDVSDLSVGDAGETGRDVDSRPFHSETFVTPTEHLSAQQQQQQHLNQHQYNRKANEKRRKVAPLDTIGGFQMSGFRNQKDEPDIYREDYRN